MSSGHDHNHGHDHGACDSESAGLATDAARIEALISEGVHRIGENEGPFSLHVLGLGEAGASIVETMVKAHSGSGAAATTSTQFSALAIDLDDAPLAAVRQAAAGAPGNRVTVDTAAIPVLSNTDLFTQLRRYREFLKNEFPRYYQL